MSMDQIKLLIALIILGVMIIGAIVLIVVSIVRGDMKEYIKECMAEAEELYKDLPKPEKSKKKLQYVIDKVKEKYKLASLFLNIKKFVEMMVEFINSMKPKK